MTDGVNVSMPAADLVQLSGDIVSAYVAHNNVRSADLPELIAVVHGALVGLTKPREPELVKLEPPVSIRRSITPDHLISLEDGRKYKSLRRHLAGYGLTPDQYRAKWGLPADYPMVSPNYSAARSEMAKNLGLGQMRKKEQAEPAETKAAPTKPKARRKAAAAGE